jgi:hypothetical protein
MALFTPFLSDEPDSIIYIDKQHTVKNFFGPYRIRISTAVVLDLLLSIPCLFCWQSNPLLVYRGRSDATLGGNYSIT